MKLIVALMLLAQSVAAVAAERPQDFAYGIEVHADVQDALYEIELPAAVYRGVTRSDLGDIRVFNAQGEVVPYAFKPRALVPQPVRDDTSSEVRLKHRRAGEGKKGDNCGYDRYGVAPMGAA